MKRPALAAQGTGGIGGTQRPAPGKGPSGGPPRGPAARPSLVPSEPMPGWLAAVQVLILLGVPLALLLIARVILHRFFPDLGY